MSWTMNAIEMTTVSNCCPSGRTRQLRAGGIRLTLIPDMMCEMSFFFFSSRRRHTRLQGDWSSDVCSSDLIGTISIRCAGRDLVLHVMNEYIAVADGDGKRLATFPDVITTLSVDGRPVSEIGRASCRERV